MAINKVQYGNTTLIDLTDTTAVASDVAQGKYFYGKDGVKTLGTASDSVTSVNGQTGAVVLDAEDVGAMPEDAEFAIGVDEASAVGTAVVGTAVTTPASFVAVGDVVGEKTTINVPTAAELRWNYSSGVLTIQGIALTVAAQTVGTGNATFVGGETSLIIKERQI